MSQIKVKLIYREPNQDLIGKRVRIKKNSYNGHPAGIIGTVTGFTTLKDPIIEAKYNGIKKGLIHDVKDIAIVREGSHVDKKYLKHCLQNGKFKLKGL